MPSDDVTLATTTGTQEEINQALGIKSDAQAETAVESETTETQEKEEQPQKHQNRAEKRIKELTKLKYDLQDQLDELREENSRLKSPKLAPAEPVVEKVTRPKPASTDPKYKTYEDFSEDLARWATEQVLAKQKEVDAETAKNERLKENFDNFNRQLAEAAEKHEDWDEVIASSKNMDIPKVAELAAIEMDNGAEVLYYLATNHAVRAKLLELNTRSELRVVQELGRISDNLQKADPPEEPEQSSEDEEDQPVAVTKAPAPVKPVGNSSTRATTKPMKDVDNFQEWKRRRAAAR